MKIRITFFLTLLTLFAQAQTFNIPFAEHRIIEWLSCDAAHDPIGFETGIGIQNLLNDPIELQFRTIESHIPSGWNYTCVGQTGTLTNCYTDLNQRDFIEGGQRIFISHEFNFLSPPEQTDSLNAKVEVFDIANPAFKDTMEMKIVFRVPDLMPIDMDLDIRNQRDAHPSGNSSSFSFSGEIVNPYIDKEMHWEETFSQVPSDWEFNCNGTLGSNVCQNTSGTLNIDCLDLFEAEFQIDITQIGNKKDSLIKRWVVFDPDDRAATELEFGFTIVRCPLFGTGDHINYSGPTSFCEGETITLNVDPNLPNITWTVDGQKIDDLPTITIPAASLITISTSDDIGCSSTDTLELDVQTPFDEQICVVTSDSVSGNNLIVWEKTDGKGTENFKIYRESVIIGQFDSIGMIPFNDLSAFVDNGVDPRVTSYQYKISTVDNCGNESELSNAHKTLHLTSSQGVNGEINLIWDNYQGIPFSTVNILTGPNLDDMQLLIQRPSNSFTFTDLNPQFNPVFYQIEIILNDPCTARRSNDYLTVRSNPVNNGVSSVSDNHLNNKVNIFPNPTTGFVFIENEMEFSLPFTITDLNGKVFYRGSAKAKSTETLQIDIPKGIYLFSGNTSEAFFTKKLIVK